MNWLAANERSAVVALVCLSLLLRSIAVAVLHLPLESDYFAYYEMARSLSQDGVMQDPGGLYAFFSAGYPLLLGLVFWIFGASVIAAQTVNILLGAISTALVYACARVASSQPWIAALATILFLLYPAAYVYTDYIAKENLTTPLLLGQLFVMLRFEDARNKHVAAASYGALSAAQLLTSPSATLVSGVAAIVILGVGRVRPWRWREAATWLTVGAICITPWMLYTARLFGTPLITTSAGFNLYIGNNPAADGYFVSISDTPAASTWHQNLKTLGEYGAVAVLREQALEYMQDHPLRTAELTVKKLVVFWLPPFHEGKGGNKSIAEALLREVWALYYVLVLTLTCVSATRWRSIGRGQIILFATVTAFWLLHGIAYVVYRYREPIMPVIIIAAALSAGSLFQRWGGNMEPTRPT